MPISNINTRSVQVNGRFAPIYDDKDSYADALLEKFPNATNNTGSDHFVSSYNALDNMMKLWDPASPDNNLDQVKQMIEQSQALQRWFIGLLCAFIYGCDDTNVLQLHSIDITSAPIFLKRWKEKFLIGAENDNDCEAFHFGVDNFVLVTFGNANAYTDWLGCYSKKYFLLPLKEYNITGNETVEWRKKFNVLEKYGSRLFEGLGEGGTLINRAHRVILRLTADSILANTAAPDALRLAAKLIEKYIANKITFPAGVKIGFRKQFQTDVALFKLYRLKKRYTEAFFDDEIAVGMNDEGTIYATYPFTAGMIEMLEQKSLEITDLKLVTATHSGPDGSTYIDKATISGLSTARFVFEDAGNNDQIYPYADAFTKEYSSSNMKIIRNIPTFCVYPNLPVHKEDRCTAYTYLTNTSSFILDSEDLNGVSSDRTLDLSSNAYFHADFDGSGQKKIFDGANKKSTLIDGKKIDILTREGTKCSHFVGLYDQNNTYCGIIVNFTDAEGIQLPALMKSGDTMKFSFVSPEDYSPNGEFFAYVDFGSSSSCIKYQVNAGALHEGQGVVEKSSTMRMVLAQYAPKTDYKYIINIPSDYTKSTFPSVAVNYDAENTVPDYYPYRHHWMPLANSASDYESIGVHLATSNKVALIDGVRNGAAANEPNTIITNIVYMVACNAIVNDCSAVTIVPSLPSEEFADSLKQVWASAIQVIKSRFKFNTFDTVLDAEGRHFLFESVAISLGGPPPGQNTLSINVDIGDSTTDMTAIYIDSQSNRNICGYSSLNYAGKQMIKSTIRDVVCNTLNPDHLRHVLKGQVPGYGEPLFACDPGKENLYNSLMDGLINNFYDGNRLKTKPQDFWENNVVEVLGISKMRADADQKIIANFIARYLFLLPVIVDFIKTSMKLAEDIGESTYKIKTIYINFYGGGSSGLELINALDRRPNNIYKHIENYFKNAFTGLTVQMDVKGSSKDSLVDGLATLDTSFSVQSNSFIVKAPAAVNNVSWEKVNPRQFEEFGASVHKDALYRQFERTEDTSSDQTNNRNIFEDPASYFAVPEDMEGTKTMNDIACEEFLEFFKKEIYDGMIDNGDVRRDPIEELFKGFVKDVNEILLYDIKADAVNGDAYNRAVLSSSIYPEMVKNAIFMFTASDMLSKHHGEIPETRIKNAATAGNYSFGG